MIRPLATLLMIALLLSGSIPAGMAQPATPAIDTCLTVSEPNDQPQDALEIGPGAACATGENPGGGQDLLRWTVTPDEADTRWSFSLSAIPGQVGLIEIYAVEEEAGTILSATKLVSQMGAAGATTEVANLMWAPGEYYIGVAFSGAGPYQFAITAGDPLPAPANASDTPITATGPLTVSDTRDVTDDVIAWTIDDPTTHLDLQVQGPAGIALSWTLTDEAGNQLAGGAVDSRRHRLLARSRTRSWPVYPHHHLTITRFRALAGDCTRNRRAIHRRRGRTERLRYLRDANHDGWRRPPRSRAGSPPHLPTATATPTASRSTTPSPAVSPISACSGRATPRARSACWTAPKPNSAAPTVMADSPSTTWCSPPATTLCRSPARPTPPFPTRSRSTSPVRPSPDSRPNLTTLSPMPARSCPRATPGSAPVACNRETGMSSG